MNTKTRPNPNGPLILKMCGYTGTPHEASSTDCPEKWEALYQGFRLGAKPSFYSHLNFNEFLAFTMGAWQMRTTRPGLLDNIRQLRNPMAAYVPQAMLEDFPDGHSALAGLVARQEALAQQDPSLGKKLAKMNPFQLNSLIQRVNHFTAENPKDAADLIALLSVDLKEVPISEPYYSRSKYDQLLTLEQSNSRIIANRIKRLGTEYINF